LLDDQVGGERLAWFGSDHGGYFEIGVGPENDSAGLPIIGAGHERAEVVAFSVDQSIAVDSHVTVAQAG
jgi:hypothetical protein